MNDALARLEVLRAEGQRPIEQIDGLYVVVNRENFEPVIGAFRSEVVADAVAAACGGDVAEVSYEPVADDDLALMEAIVEQYGIGEEDEEEES